MPACVESDDRRGATRSKHAGQMVDLTTPRSVPSRLKPQEPKLGGNFAHADRADGGNAQGGLQRLKVDDEHEIGETRCAWRAHEDERRREEADHCAAADTDHPDRA